MTISELIELYLRGNLPVLSAPGLLDARQRITDYYDRIATIQPATDHTSAMLSMLLDLAEALTRQLDIH